MEFYFSLLLYILTFIIGLLLNNKQDKNIYKRIFVIWLYAFLCFGYMTGSDWRSYELHYLQAAKEGYIGFLTDIGFNYLFVGLGKVMSDFFLALGLLKCMYLFTLVKLIKSYTSNWLSAIMILMPVSLIFLLIDNPLRFMVALTFVNLGLFKYKQGRKLWSYIFLVSAILFHVTTIVFLILPSVINNSYKVYNLNTYVIIFLYILVSFVSCNSAIIESVKNNIVGQLILVMEMKDYTQSYNIENNDAFFTLGSLIQILVFGIIVFSKKCILSSSKLRSLYGLAIIYLFVSRILIIVPTGFRLAIPLGYFYSIYIVYLLSHKYFIGYIITIYLALVMVKNIYQSYTYAPYSNSIMYIIFQNHKNYSERINYNLDAYYRRTGRPVE